MKLSPPRWMALFLVASTAWNLGFAAPGTAPAAEPANRAEQPAPRKTPQAWSLDEAIARSRMAPKDVYLQYVVLQLARNEGKLDEMGPELPWLRPSRSDEPNREVDLFAMFTGALAVQEALQIDTMLAENAADNPSEANSIVSITDLAGPEIESHPWGKMLAAQSIAGKVPEISPLALCVPADRFFVHSQSLTKLLELADAGDLWGAHLFNQVAKSAQTHDTSGRLKQQLAVRTDPLSRPFYDMVVADVALTGSDLYFREGTDVTVLFRLKQPKVFRARMDGFLLEAEKSRPDAVRTIGTIDGVEYVHVATPDRAIHVFSAYPRPDLHVRSNSKAGLQCVLATIAGGKDMERLGETTELKYIRTLFEQGDPREDVFIYLSDPFIRRQVGPTVKLTERRRMICYNHLRMIGHAATLYQTQYGRAPKSLAELAAHGCAPGVFGEGALRCPCGGQYALSADGTQGVCSVHGHADRLVPGSETTIEQVTEAEAQAYREFVEQYNQYWRQYFDPIVIRLQAAPKQYRAETLILPMLDNSLYTGLATTLGGEPEPLDALPVPPSNIFSMVVRWNKEKLLAESDALKDLGREMADVGLPPSAMRVSPKDLLEKGLGNQVGLHVCDASPMFDMNLTSMMGDMLRGAQGGNWGSEMTMIGFLVASLNTPVYLSAPVRDTDMVDTFLDDLDGMLATMARQQPRAAWFEIDHDFYKLQLDGLTEPARCYTLSFGPVKWRVFFARLGNGLYIASKPFILEEIAKLADRKPDAPGPTAHGMIRIRPEHWNQILATFRLGWAESSRQSCLDNLASLSSVARAMRASIEAELTMKAVQQRAAEVQGVDFFCPDGGKYELSVDGTQVTCSVHGGTDQPRQQAAPSAGSPIDRVMKDFAGATAELTFLEDGLHAVVTIRRK